MSRSSKEKIVLPGLSYIPDALEIAEDRNLQKKLSLEFMDFIMCVYDLLNLLDNVKIKHLRSMKPLPFDVIREIKTRDETRNYRRQREFEKRLPELSIGISPSAEISLMDRPSTFFNNGRRRPTKVFWQASQSKASIPFGVLDLKDIIGPKRKPIWHQMAKEKQETTVDVAEKERKTSKQLTEEMSRMSDNTGKRVRHNKDIYGNFDINDIKREPRRRSAFSIKFATSDKCTETVSPAQVDIMNAYAAGFETVERHRAWQELMIPHWYLDLIKNSLKLGIRHNQQMVEAFNKLGKFLDVNCTTFPLSRAKLCFLTQSLPTWDIARLVTQRAVEFILKDILMTPNPSYDLQMWMSFRRLPYLVVSPNVAK